MTKVSPHPHPQKSHPIILINNEEHKSSETSSHADRMVSHNEATNLNKQKENVPENFCEFNKSAIIPDRKCHHVTCLYRKDIAKNTIKLQQSAKNLGTLENLESTLTSEKRVHDERSQRRSNTFLSILRNDAIEFSLVKFLLYTLGITFFGFFLTLPSTLAPGHDLVRCPEYWFEILYNASVSTIETCFLNCYLSDYFLNVRYTVKPKNILIITLVALMSTNSIIAIIHYIWTAVLEYQFPIPFLGNALFSGLTIPFCILIWFNFPKEWRRDKEFRNRMRYYTCFWALVILLVIAWRAVIDFIIHYQSVFIFIQISRREIYLWIANKIIERTSEGDLGSARIMLKYYIYTAYPIQLCTLLASHLSDVSTWVLVAADFLINILKCFRLIWARKRSCARIMNQIDLLQDLIICELVEFQASLAFIFTFICAYYGPNGELFGNVLNGYWNFIATKDMNQKLYKWTLYFLADFSSMIVSGISLWLAFKINIFKAILDLQLEFWPAFVVILGTLLTHVSKKVYNFSNKETNDCIEFLSKPTTYM